MASKHYVYKTLMARDRRFVGEVGSRERRSIDLCFWFDCYETTKHSILFRLGSEWRREIALCFSESTEMR